MRCRDAEHALALHLNERIGGPLPPALAAHLADCRACRAEWMALQRVESLFTPAPLAEPPAGFLDAVLARIEADAEQMAAAPARQRWSRRRPVLGTGLAAGVLLLLALMAGSVTWGLIICGLGFLTFGWLQSPQVANATQVVVEQAGFWATTLFQTARVVVGAVLPLLASAVLVFVFVSVLAYALTLAWAWLIGRVWWPGELQIADCRLRIADYGLQQS